jgi:hypothetical protein
MCTGTVPPWPNFRRAPGARSWPRTDAAAGRAAARCCEGQPDGSVDHPDDAYRGSYANDFYGTFEVTEGPGGLSLVEGPAKVTYPLTHFDGNTFIYFPVVGIPHQPVAIESPWAPMARPRPSMSVTATVTDSGPSPGPDGGAVSRCSKWGRVRLAGSARWPILGMWLWRCRSARSTWTLRNVDGTVGGVHAAPSRTLTGIECPGRCGLPLPQPSRQSVVTHRPPDGPKSWAIANGARDTAVLVPLQPGGRRTSTTSAQPR